MSILNSSAARRGTNISGRLWIMLTMVFCATSVALAAYLIYVKAFEQKGEASREEKIIRKFPGFFRTLEEQAKFEEQYNESMEPRSDSEVVNGTYLDMCDFSCYFDPTPTNRTRREADDTHALVKRATIQVMAVGPPMYHACCISNLLFISPDTAVDIDGTTVRLEKFQKRRQYFPTELCKHADGCTGCRCTQEPTFMAAVVEPADDDDTVNPRFIKLPGCCKCFNRF